MSRARNGTTFMSEDGADIVMDLAAQIERGEPTFIWLSTSGWREVRAKVIHAWKLGDGQPSWRQYGIMYDLGPFCRGWPSDDGSPSVQAIAREDAL